MSPFDRHGIVVPVAFVHVAALWLSSNVRNVFPVVSLRKNAKWPKVVDAVGSGLANATRRLDLPGVQPPAERLNAQASGASSLTPPT